MTKKQMEMHIKSLEENLATLAKKVYDRDSANETKIDKVDVTVAEQGATISDNTENIETTNSVTDMILTDLFPETEGQISDINETIDMILTEVIPDMMGDE